MIAYRASQINETAEGTTLYGVIDWVSLLPTFLSLLGMCRKPTKPAPVNPTPQPTQQQATAWEDAWRMKSGATDNWDGQAYSDKILTRTARHIRKAKKRDGQPITKPESVEAALLALDNARLSEMPDLYHDVLEARHATNSEN